MVREGELGEESYNRGGGKRGRGNGIYAVYDEVERKLRQEDVSLSSSEIIHETHKF